MNYVMDILIISFIFVILSSSFNLLLGFGGMISLAHSVFYGLGAYFSALLVIHTGLPVIVALIIGMVLTALVSLLLVIPTLKVSGDYLAIATLGFQIVVVEILLKIDITGGPAGLTGIPRMQFFNITFSQSWMYALFTGIVALLSVGFTIWITRLPFGRLLKGMREDEVASMGLGKNIYSIRITIFAISSAMAALAGGLFGHYYLYINPNNFNLLTSILIITMVVIGGMGTIWGPVVGSLILIGLPELLRFVPLPPGINAPLKQILYSILVLVFIYFRPNGILGRNAKVKETVPAKGIPANHSEFQRITDRGL
jgi:branched-chain amino acid transport system permease protein